MKVYQRISAVLLSVVWVGMGASSVSAKADENQSPSLWSLNIYKPYMKWSEIYG